MIFHYQPGCSQALGNSTFGKQVSRQSLPKCNNAKLIAITLTELHCSQNWPIESCSCPQSAQTNSLLMAQDVSRTSLVCQAQNQISLFFRGVRQLLPEHKDMGSIAIPGAVVMVNNDLSSSVQNRLQIQLHIDETITGQDLDLRIAADPNYTKNVRAMRQRVLVMRDFRETNNRTEMDLVIFIRSSMVYVEKNCFGPTGQTFALKNIYWGQLGIFDTDVDRSCQTDNCGCSVPESGCGCGNSSEQVICGKSPYYPARFDPKYPAENHWYNQVRESHVFSSTGCCGNSTDRVLCRKYWCESDGKVLPLEDCREVKQ